MHTRPQRFCPVRKKWVASTPEEAVRQDLIQHLHWHGGVPLTLMGCEYPLRFNGLQYRADLVVFHRQGTLLLLAECKAPTVPLTQEVFCQLQRYNHVLRVPTLLLTNGNQEIVCTYNPAAGSYTALPAIPTYAQLAALPQDKPS